MLTTRWHTFGDQCRAILGLPETAQIHAIIPAGWPLGRFGRTSRLPIEQVTFRDRWGAPWRVGG